MESNELLSVSGLSKDFHSKRVLDDVTFAVAPGEIVALVGRNGAGKSTLGRIIAGTESESAGTISSLGVEYPRASRLEARARKQMRLAEARADEPATRLPHRRRTLDSGAESGIPRQSPLHTSQQPIRIDHLLTCA